MRKVIVLAACASAVFASMPAPAGAASQHRHHYYGHAYYGHAPRAPYVAYGSRPGVADPAFMPNPLYDFYRRNHICAIDEGYGRATRCD